MCVCRKSMLKRIKKSLKLRHHLLSARFVAGTFFCHVTKNLIIYICRVDRVVLRAFRSVRVRNSKFKPALASPPPKSCTKSFSIFLECALFIYSIPFKYKDVIVQPYYVH